MQQAQIAALGLAFLFSAIPAEGQTLRGSKATMMRQHQIAQSHDFTFLRSATDVRRFVGQGYLVRLGGNANYELGSVRYPYARPALKLFVERLSAQYRNACGERMVVTSLTRPTSEQPRNASDLSVHPTGMAVDLRIPKKASCRRWLEKTLLALEQRSVLDAIRERFPPHYHIAVFPEQYLAYVDRLTPSAPRVVVGPVRASTPVVAAAARPSTAVATAEAQEPAEAGPSASEPVGYRVNRGDSLWSIARRHGVTVADIKSVNNLSSSRIAPGQILSIPAPTQ
jgi:LysM repeat protein